MAAGCEDGGWCVTAFLQFPANPQVREVVEDGMLEVTHRFLTSTLCDITDFLQLLLFFKVCEVVETAYWRSQINFSLVTCVA